MFGSAAPSNWADVLTLIGAGLKDASPISQGGNLQAAQGMIMQRNMMRGAQQALGQIPSLFGARTASAAPAAAPIVTDPGTGPTLKGPGEDGDPIGPAERAPTFAPAAASSASALAPTGGPDWDRIAAAAPLYKALYGIDLAPSIEAMKAAQPHIAIGPSGEAYNDKDPSVANKVFPTVEKGQIVLRDVKGNPLGVMNLPGSVDAAAQMASATEGAKAQAQAGWDVIPVQMSDGSTMQLPRAMAAQILAQRYANGGAPSAGLGASGASPGAGGGGAAFGVSQTPAAAELAKQRAATQGKREELQPKEFGALQDLDNTSLTTSQIIHQILGDAQDPKTRQWVPGGKPQATPWTTGAVGELLHDVPGTPQHDLDQQLEHIRAMTSMEQLQNLRDNSPTGAGLGRVTQQEINLLAAMRGSIDQGQRLPQMQQNLRRQLGMLDQMIANRRNVYQQTYGNVLQAQPGASQPSPGAYGASAPGAPKASAAPPTYSRADVAAEMRRRGLIP
jgi:hypothetical protein